MFEKNLSIGYLLDFYGQLLNDRKRELLEMYYNDDLSLSEIGENVGISRQGVRDNIKKAEEELLFFEEKLGLAKKFRDLSLHASNIRGILSENANAKTEGESERADFNSRISSEIEEIIKIVEE